MPFSLFLWKIKKKSTQGFLTEFLRGTRLAVDVAGGGNFWTVHLSDLRCRHKEQEAPLKSHLDARLTVQGRAPWPPGPARAHTGGIHSPAATALCARPLRPRPQTELSVSVPESSLHGMNCNNWQVGRWLEFTRGS